MQNSAKPMRIGYLVNQYPKVSHSFIRREIAGIENCDIEVSRFSIRSCEGELVDARDLSELAHTCILFNLPFQTLLLMFLWGVLRNPLGSLKTLGTALKLGGRSDSGRLKHLIYFFEACILFRWCHQQELDHLHAHFGTNSTSVALLCKSLGGPTYSFTVHGPEEFDRAPGLYLDEKINRASFVVAISSFGRSQLYRLCEYKQWPKIRLVHCGIDDLFLEQLPKPLPPSNQLVCVGRLCPQKGQLLLVDAVRQARDQGFDLHLSFVGDGPLRSRLEEHIAVNRLQDVISITGWVDAEQVRREIENSLALVLPSFAEGLPVVLMESLCLGRPVISTYVAGIPELVRPGENGWLIPAGTVSALTDSLIALLRTSPDQLQSMGLAGREAAIAQHSIHRETRLLAALFKAVHCHSDTRFSKYLDQLDESDISRKQFEYSPVINT